MRHQRRDRAAPPKSTCVADLCLCSIRALTAAGKHVQEVAEEVDKKHVQSAGAHVIVGQQKGRSIAKALLNLAL